MRTDMEPFAMVPEDLISNVSASALQVWCALARHANSDGEAWPAVRTLAERTRLSSDTVRRCIKELEKYGRVKVLEQLNDNNAHTVNLYRLYFARHELLESVHAVLALPDGMVSKSTSLQGRQQVLAPVQGGVLAPVQSALKVVNENQLNESHVTRKDTSTQNLVDGAPQLAGKKAKDPPPMWAQVLALAIRTHTLARFNKVISDEQVNKWAMQLDKLTRSSAFKDPPTQEDVIAVLKWGMEDSEERGTWRGWSMQIQSAPDADKFNKVWLAMKSAGGRINAGNNGAKGAGPVSSMFKDPAIGGRREA